MGLLAGALWFYYGSYQDKAEEYRRLNLQYNEQVAINTTQQARIQHLAELDTQHTQELAHAKTEIDTLRADVAAGRRKLRIKATCPVSETPASRGVVDAGTPQLTEPARQDYYRLREMMAENERQTKYLQDYIKTECYKVTK